MRHTILLSLLMAVAMPAMAVYKCVSQDHVTYSDVPCGAAQVVLPPPPPSIDAAGARQQVDKERRQLAAIEKARDAERASREREQRADRKDKAARADKKKCVRLELERKWSAEDAASVSKTISAKTEAIRRAARRKAERHDAECGAAL
ncbi:DUF4124 domain-containing protein [Noviherbaspirillum suwonense]|jgi:hypothetical protein|uniref:DUF4124 domain-containing protein n=1 Tax=Noviherbaspirillum suwonense TaxID=1224511 RepID=A0ABY1Q2V8_9BURK|nr:DUF4124 domain-containing protein [Noviherbaspirillum suwonense]SMP54445.1 hypothetical protein SAMN06295970_10416 [Noviherbaspirillum suwonense]